MEGAVAVEYSVEVGVDVGCPVGDGELTDALLSILERYEQAGELAGPVVGAEGQAVLAPRFNVEAPDPMGALEAGQRLVARAMGELGIHPQRWHRLLVEPYDPGDPDLEPLRHPATTPAGDR